MKTEIHPEYDHVVFRDAGAGATFLTRSTAKSSKTIELDGETYPVIDVELSSASHPFYTGKQKIVDTAGRVERFRRRAAKRQADEAKPAAAAPAAAPAAKPAATASSSEAEAPQDA